MAPKFKRNHYSDREKYWLFNLAEREKHIIECRDIQNHTLQQKRKAWERIAEAFNADKRVVTTLRSVEELRKFWMNHKLKLRQSLTRQVNLKSGIRSILLNLSIAQNKNWETNFGFSCALNKSGLPSFLLQILPRPLTLLYSSPTKSSKISLRIIKYTEKLVTQPCKSKACQRDENTKCHWNFMAISQLH